MTWCRPLRNDAETASVPDLRGVFSVTLVNAVGATPAAIHCVALGEEPGDTKRCSSGLLTDRKNVTAGEMQAMATGSTWA